VSDGLAARLRASLQRQEARLQTSLILNPVENVPFADDLAVVSGPLHGLYNSDKTRTREQRLGTDLQFSGRESIEEDSRAIYAAWAKALNAADATLRILSGLHAHVTLFMAMAKPGQRVMLLPIEGGGHLSGKAILERLGLVVEDLPIDTEAMRVDISAALERCAEDPPDFLFVDRSEGLVFEDLSPLAEVAGTRTVFDSSQYLTNVICGDHPNPFQWGFDLMVASVHKNFPGPQKALLATREADEEWKRILSGVSTYVSNMHSTSTYAAALTLTRDAWLREYSRRMLRVAVALEDELAERRVPVVRRPRELPPTHHVWIREADRERAFTTYERLEQCLILTNFRRLPYGLGLGLRLGVNSVARLGLDVEDVPRLAELIAEIRASGPTAALRAEANAFSRSIWSRSREGCSAN
jgi:glycine hydroxymethyltransferase